MLKFFKKIRSEPIAAIVLVLLTAVFCVAGFSGFDALRLTPKSTDTYTIDSRNTSGTTTFSVTPDGAGVLAGTLSATTVTLTGISGTGVVSSTNIADITRSFEIPLAGMFINAAGPMGNDGTTAPGMATTDGIPKVVYASSGETASIGYSFGVPTDYVGALAFRMLVSSSAATPASMSIDWEIWVNKNGVVFDAVPFSQTAVSPTIDNSATNEFLTFTADATALAGIAAGDTITVWFWNADTRASGTTEIGALQSRYTATQ